MTKYYIDYCWKQGIPYGLGSGSIDPDSSKESYKIVMDPYRKRIAIEKYLGKDFLSVIYDSAFIDFRHLKSVEQIAWQKTTIKNEDINYLTCLIRNQDDRLLFIETYLFDGDFCRECQSHSPFGHLLSLQRMCYKSLGDQFDGVTLFDTNERPVMQKKYATDVKTGEFAELLEEIWDGRLI